jgi:hypothetical protein
MTTPMSAERFADRFRFYRNQPQQQRGVQQLYGAIGSSDQGTAILDEQAPWALTFSQQPPPRQHHPVASIPAAQKGPGWLAPTSRHPSKPGIPTCW